jgi:hypothetical protein
MGQVLHGSATTTEAVRCRRDAEGGSWNLSKDVDHSEIDGSSTLLQRLSACGSPSYRTLTTNLGITASNSLRLQM